MNMAVHVPGCGSCHVAVVLLKLVQVAMGALPTPMHTAVHVAPTVLLRQPGTQFAFMTGSSVCVGTPLHLTARQQEKQAKSSYIS